MPRRLKPQVIYKQKCITHYVCIHAVITLLALFRVKNIFMRDRANTECADTLIIFLKRSFYIFESMHYQTRYIPLIRISTQPVTTLK